MSVFNLHLALFLTPISQSKHALYMSILLTDQMR